MAEVIRSKFNRLEPLTKSLLFFWGFLFVMKGVAVLGAVL